MEIPSGQQISVHHNSAAGKLAANASCDQHIKNIRSTKVSSVQDRLDRTSGKANCSTSRTPAGRTHQAGPGTADSAIRWSRAGALMKRR